jgi:hypothetical protein
VSPETTNLWFPSRKQSFTAVPQIPSLHTFQLLSLMGMARPWRRLDDNIKIDLELNVGMWTGFTCIGLRTSIGILWTRE